MESSTTNGTAPSRPGRSRRGRALAVAVLAAGTADRGPFDPAFGQPAASR